MIDGAQQCSVLKAIRGDIDVIIHRHSCCAGSECCFFSNTIKSFRLPLTSLCDLPLLFVYFQVNNGVLYILDYVEDIYIVVLFAFVPM